MSLHISDEITGRSVRRSDGWALESIRLAWSGAVAERFDSSAEIPSYPRNGKAVLTFVDDVKTLRVAINDMLLDSETAQTSLGDYPFDRQRLVSELFSRLELPYRDVGHLGPQPPNPTRFSKGTAVGERSADTGSGISLFEKHCSACHQSGSRFPPNFLDGSAQDRARKIAYCSERIVYRLAMWLRETGSRTKSPMPPQAYLESTGVDPETWQNSSGLAALLEHAVRHTGGTDDEPSLDSVLRRSYGDLRRCIPQTD